MAIGLLSRPHDPAGPKRDAAGNGAVYLGIPTLVYLTYILVGGVVDFRSSSSSSSSSSVEHADSIGFVGRNGTRFVLDGKPFYVNGWNSYWLMDQAVEDFSRPRVGAMFRAATDLGLTVCRTWAFNDGATDRALQLSLGRFDERVFQALDRVVVEARRHGIRLILSLVNNLQDHGGKTQYVKWAWDAGIGLSTSNNSFFFDPSIRGYFKAYVKTILRRKNHLNGLEYRDDPTIFAWELMNEPECMSDPTGDTLQDWIEEMAGYVKSIDKKHLVTVGFEGFYGPTSTPGKLSVNPGDWYRTLGLDFIRNNKISSIDFASVHIYPDHWMEAPLDEKMEYISKWVTSHIEDGDVELAKPVMFTEFGLSNKNKDFDPSHRDTFYKYIYDTIYESAANNGAGAGSLIWQLLVEGMEEYNDDFGFVPGENPSLDRLLKDQSCRLEAIRQGKDWARSGLKKIC